MEDFIPFFMIFFFIVRAIISANKKSKKKSLSATDVIKKLEDLAKRFEEPTKQPVEIEPVIVEEKRVEYQPLSRKYSFDMPEAVSSEITQAPYSNLEEGILDETHKSKFQHHNKQVLISSTKKKKNIFGKVSAKEAFKYSIIFEKKHF